jgi:predicted MPP superfamily phosphohydrolase
VPPQATATILAHLHRSHGRFAVLGNHDYIYGAQEIAAALRKHAIIVLDNKSRTVSFENHSIDLVGIPDARIESEPPNRCLPVSRGATDHCAYA